MKKTCLGLALLLIGLASLAQAGLVQARPAGQALTPNPAGSLFLPLILRSPTCSQSFAAIPPDNLVYEQQVVALINQERTSRGLSALAISPELTQAARLHSRFMADNDYWGHDWPDGTSPWDRMHWACYNFRAAGENIAAGYQTPVDVVKGWMGSTGHRAIILDPAFSEIGVGYAYNASSTYDRYWTADFGSR